jgi:hypothetical protein
MSRVALLQLAFASIVLIIVGCSSPTTLSSNVEQDSSAADAKPLSDPATYTFHRNVRFEDVTRTLPDGSVDHIDFDATVNPSVIVLVKVSVPATEDLAFTTIFTGPDDLKVVKKWEPAADSDKSEHVALFILPEAITAGFTLIGTSNPKSEDSEKEPE